MSYLLDKKIKNKKIFKIAFGVIFLIILFFFRAGIFNGFSKISHKIFRPVLITGNNLGDKFKSFGAYFVSKSYLYEQNQKLQAQVDFNNARNSNYDSVVAGNISIKEILNRKDLKVPMVLSAILNKPNRSIYDTLVIDVGAKEGIKTGNTVFALGNVPIGQVDIVYDNSSKVILFSNAGETTQAVISSKNLPVLPTGQAVGRQDVFMELVGRGGGNFEMIMPKDLTMQKGDQVVMPGISPYVLAIAQTVISDP